MEQREKTILCWYCKKACNMYLCKKPEIKPVKETECKNFVRDIPEPTNSKKTRLIYPFRRAILSKRYVNELIKAYTKVTKIKKKHYLKHIEVIINRITLNFKNREYCRTLQKPLDYPQKDVEKKTKKFKAELEAYVYKNDPKFEKRFKGDNIK